MPKQWFGAYERKILGRNVAAARERAGFNTSIEAAAAVGVPPSRLSEWENGRKLPGADSLMRLAVGYGCRLDDFLGAVNGRYDALIEKGIPIDVRRHYEARMERVKELTLRAMDLTVSAIGEHVPTPTTPAAPRATTGGKLRATRARLTPKKKTPKKLR